MSLDYFIEEASKLEGFESFGGVSEKLVSDAAQSLNVVFPEVYVQFLREVGCVAFGPHEVCGLGGPKHQDITLLTLMLRQDNNLHPLLVPLKSDGFGNYDCLLCSDPSQSESDFREVLSVPSESSHSQTEHIGSVLRPGNVLFVLFRQSKAREFVANDLWSWLMELVEDAGKFERGEDTDY